MLLVVGQSWNCTCTLFCGHFPDVLVFLFNQPFFRTQSKMSFVCVLLNIHIRFVLF